MVCKLAKGVGINAVGEWVDCYDAHRGVGCRCGGEGEGESDDLCWGLDHDGQKKRLGGCAGLLDEGRFSSWLMVVSIEFLNRCLVWSDSYG